MIILLLESVPLFDDLLRLEPAAAAAEDEAGSPPCAPPAPLAALTCHPTTTLGTWLRLRLTRDNELKRNKTKPEVLVLGQEEPERSAREQRAARRGEEARSRTKPAGPEQGGSLMCQNAENNKHLKKVHFNYSNRPVKDSSLNLCIGTSIDFHKNSLILCICTCFY